MFSFFLPKSLVRVRPVSRKCVGRADQSATCLCALYLSQCSILVCVCFVLVCIRCHCLYEFKVYVCLCSFACLFSIYLYASCVLLGILFIISVRPLLVQMLFFSSVICVLGFFVILFFLECVALLLVSSQGLKDMMSQVVD